MWVDAGFSPDSFWHQTPRSFQVAMAGVRRRMERDAEARFLLAYDTAALVATAQAGKLKKYEHYARKQEAPAQTPAAMLAALKAVGGGTMKIRKVKMGERRDGN